MDANEDRTVEPMINRLLDEVIRAKDGTSRLFSDRLERSPKLKRVGLYTIDVGHEENDEEDDNEPSPTRSYARLRDTVDIFISAGGSDTLYHTVFLSETCNRRKRFVTIMP